MEKTQQDKSMLVSHTSFGAGKPVAPFSGPQQINAGRSLDPSSYLRADRYPVPNLFDHRSSSRERNLLA